MKTSVLCSLLFLGAGFYGHAQQLWLPGAVNGATAGIGSSTTANVGIGTDSPGDKLTVAGNIGIPRGNMYGFGVASDNFVYDAKTVGNYSLGWFSDTWQAGAPTAFISGFGGIK